MGASGGFYGYYWALCVATSSPSDIPLFKRANSKLNSIDIAVEIGIFRKNKGSCAQAQTALKMTFRAEHIDTESLYTADHVVLT